MFRICIMVVFLLFSPLSIFSQCASCEELSEEEKKEQMQATYKKMQEIQKEVQKRQKEYLKRVKNINPEAYRQKKEAWELEAKIQKIVTSFREVNISDKVAQKRLYPLVKKLMQSTLDTSNRMQ